MEAIASAACIMFIFVSANHLGLISKIEELTNCRLPIINCVKCGSFWATLIYLVVSTKDIIVAVALAFMFAYLALWLELAMCVVDTLYKRIYEKIISESPSDAVASSADKSSADSAVSHMRKK